ncbi:hypothetical protein QPK87_11515 [Kamptonema cortianum]|nr:hypothetical protein [Oscillatoria laete-virens]MDK3157202.1 hypothetical protein [Kamptonema cortianum]MDL5054452.1 hypothetical protein [Oscillatoria laete-virens NRMC-F 0139]
MRTIFLSVIFSGLALVLSACQSTKQAPASDPYAAETLPAQNGVSGSAPAAARPEAQGNFQGPPPAFQPPPTPQTIPN